MHEEQEDTSAGELMVPKFPAEVIEVREQRPSESKPNSQREEIQGDHQKEEPMEIPSKTRKGDDGNASVDGASGVYFQFLDENYGLETVVGTSETAEDEFSILGLSQLL